VGQLISHIHSTADIAYIWIFSLLRCFDIYIKSLKRHTRS